MTKITALRRNRLPKKQYEINRKYFWPALVDTQMYVYMYVCMYVLHVCTNVCMYV